MLESEGSRYSVSMRGSRAGLLMGRRFSATPASMHSARVTELRALGLTHSKQSKKSKHRPSGSQQNACNVNNERKKLLAQGASESSGQKEILRSSSP